LAFINLGVILPDGSMRSADVAWLSRERWESLTRQEREQFLRIIPEFVAEIRCWTDSETALEIKMHRWMATGVQLGWAIDPERKLAMIYRFGREPETLFEPEFLEGEGSIAGFRLAMQEFWK
jgi:Uma2 family endonuclease